MKKKLQTTFSTRQYMLSKDFEIYYYSDYHFSGVKNHTHDYYEFYFFLEGAVAMYIDGVPHPLTPGDVILIPPGVPHHAMGLNPEKIYRRFVFWISRDFLEQLKSSSNCYGYLTTLAMEHRRFIHHYDTIALHSLQARIFRLIEELHSERFGREEKVKLCVSELILHLNRTVYEAEHPDVPHEEHRLYENLIQYIERHLDEKLTLDHLAGIFYVNKYHIAHIFKENLGISVHQYILKKRLSMCRDAILSNASISRVYLLYGFRDYSTFYRAFKREFGISPKECRELHTLPESKHEQ